MQTIPHTQPGEPADQASGPGQVATALRGAGRILGRLFGLAVIAAAGVAGWFAVEHYVFPELPGSVAAAVNETPWPDEFVQPTTTWDSFTLAYTIDGVETHQTSFDPATKRTLITYGNAEGAMVSEVELAGMQAFERLAGSQEWTIADPARVDTHVELGVHRVEPVHLSALVPSEAYPFTRVTELAELDGVRRFEVVIDAPGMLNADPIAYYRWNEAIESGVESPVELRWVVDVRPDGYIVYWEGRSDSAETWTDYPVDLVFESPLAALAAPVDPAAAEVEPAAVEPTVDPAVIDPKTAEG